MARWLEQPALNRNRRNWNRRCGSDLRRDDLFRRCSLRRRSFRRLRAAPVGAGAGWCQYTLKL